MLVIPRNTGGWDRQPTEATRLRPDYRSLGLIHALMPGITGLASIYDHAQATIWPPNNPAGDGIGLTQTGKALQMHPAPGGGAGYGWQNSVQTVRLGPGSIGELDDITVIWCGYIDNGGGDPNNAQGQGYGSLWAYGTDNGGDVNNTGWGARAFLINSGTTLRSSYIYPQIGRVDADIALNPNPASPIGGYLAAAFRKRGGSPTIDAFSSTNRQKSTASGGNGRIRQSVNNFGFEIAGRAETGTFTGHNRCLVFLAFRGYLTDDLIWSLLAYPHQMWMREDSPLWVPMDAGATPGQPYVGIRSGYKVGGVLYDSSLAQAGYRADGANRILVPEARGYAIGGTKYRVT